MSDGLVALIMATVADDDVAAVLLVGLGSGLLSDRDVVAVVDAEIVSRPDAASWLLDASLAASMQSLSHVLTERAGAHPMLDDPVSVLDAADAAERLHFRSSERLVAVALSLYPYVGLPDDLNSLAWCLDYLATGEQGESAPAERDEQERALRDLLAAARGRSRWRHLLEWLVAAAQREGS